MKKIVSIVLVGIIGITIIPKTLVNEKHVVLESTTSVYTKEEVDSLLSAIRTNITNNTNELTNIKSELTALQNSLKDYALKTSLNTTNSNIDGLNTIVTDNASRIDTIENGKELIADAITNKGITTNSTDSFENMAVNIEKIESGGTYGKWKIDVGSIRGYDGNTKTWYQPNAPEGILVVYLTINKDGTYSTSVGAGSVKVSKVS